MSENQAMTSKILTILITALVLPIYAKQDMDDSKADEHAMVTESKVFPYMATVLKGNKYLTCGALLDRSWVLTSAKGLILIRESLRLLQIRLGSINYKKGGVLVPVKLLEIHPYYDLNKPGFDLALIMLAKPVRVTKQLHPIRLQTSPAEVTATHFVVTSWPRPLENNVKNRVGVQSMDMIKRDRVLSVTHVHPTDSEDCAEELMDIGVQKDSAICLEPTENNPCSRDMGAPMVLNNVLWGIISSWKPEDCSENYSGSIFAILVSERNVSAWIHANMRGHRWDPNDV